MKDLSAQRRDWSEIEQFENELIVPLTPRQGAQQFLALYKTFESTLIQTEDTFRPQRESHVLTLQTRLQKLAQWQKNRDAKLIS